MPSLHKFQVELKNKHSGKEMEGKNTSIGSQFSKTLTSLKHQHVKASLHSNYCTWSKRHKKDLWFLLSKCAVGYILLVEYFID